jgi:hypothetical protein
VENTISLAKGKWMLIGIIIFLLGVSLLSVILNPTITAFVRFGFNVLLCVAMYRGHSWAKWLVGIFAILAGLFGLYVGFTIAEKSFQVSIVGFVVAAAYIGSAGLLFGSKSIWQFIDAQSFK